MLPQTSQIKMIASEASFLPQASLTQQIPSSSPVLTQFLKGGLPLGALCEWGLPWGYETRDLITSFLSSHSLQQNNPLWTLWIHTRQDTSIYPPAWQAQGVDLSYVRFAYSRKPLQDLRMAFLSPFFKIIVLDLDQGIYLKPEECAFLAKIARKHNALIMILRGYSLSPKNGNVWAKLRLNAWRKNHSLIEVQIIKGLIPRRILLKNLNMPFNPTQLTRTISR